MAQLDINPAGNKEGSNLSNPQVPQLKPTVQVNTIVRYCILIGLIFVIAGAILFGLNLMKKSNIKSSENKINQAEQTISQNAALNQQAEAVFAQVQNLQKLWDQRAIWSNLLNEISKTVSKTTKIDSISLDDSNKLTIIGRVDTMSSLAVTLTSFEDDSNFSNVNLNSINFTDNNINFELISDISPSLLSVKPITKTTTK